MSRGAPRVGARRARAGAWRDAFLRRLARPAVRACAALLCGAAPPWAQAAPGYVPQGTCQGWPRVQLQTPPGTCAALVASAADGLRFPRRVLEVAPGRLWVVDMGSWEPRRGRLLEVVPAGGRAVVRTLLEGLDRPLALQRAPDGRVWVGEARRLWRTVADAGVVQPQVMADGLPADGAHPLKEIAFGPDGAAYVNVGSASDACRSDGGGKPYPCAEGRAEVWRLPPGGQPQPYAHGLRNSVALAWVPGKEVLLQAENSIDYPDAAAPPEELNRLLPGRHYGWPYCVGRRQPARGYEGRHDCAATEAPLQLWPAHAAPLQLLVPAQGPWAGQLLAAWHGHRATGHRVVALALDAQGLPTGAPRTVVGGWDALPGVRPQGAPTGITVDAAGRLWIVEDRNRTLLMVAPDAP